MDPPAIKVEGLGKLYRIGRPASTNFRETLASTLRRTAGRGAPPETFWALRHVEFEVERGGVLGVVGHNGAGKSTLLKLLAGITVPTEGRIALRGRIGSLLEVGTGFHPELTGRENIYLNGAILGMSRGEVDSKFDDIVRFSEVERFLDTPVKRYSSGMYLRLAFGVAAHLDPEILLVDEVLAVGDAAFQRKCLGKMGEVARGGRTILFVSHNLTAVRNICDTALWMHRGTLRMQGATSEVTEAYLRQSLRANDEQGLAKALEALPADPAFRLQGVELSQQGRPADSVLNGQPLSVKIHYEVLQRTTGLRVYFDLMDESGDILIRSFHDDDAPAVPTVEPGQYVSTAIIPADILAPREYELRIRATIHDVRSLVGEGVGLPLRVETTTTLNRAYPADRIRSKLLARIPWSTDRKGVAKRFTR